MDSIPPLLHHPLNKESKLLGTVVYKDIYNLGAKERACYRKFFFFFLAVPQSLQDPISPIRG